MAGGLEPAPVIEAGGVVLADLTAVEPLPILLVDDRPENLRALETALAPLAYPLETTTSGHRALRRLLEREFALILLDVRMPGLDGLETARAIKSRDRTRDIPIVFLAAARDEVSDVMRAHGVGAVDYVMKPFDAELLRSKVAVFAELEASRRGLKRSESLLRAAFEAAPIGKTMLDAERRIVRSNPAFAELVGRGTTELQGVPIADLCQVEDRDALEGALDLVKSDSPTVAAPARAAVDLRLNSTSASELWVALVATSIESAELAERLVLAQWVDVSARRRAEEARAELRAEHAARKQAEALAARLEKLQTLTAALETLSLDELLPELARRFADMFEAELAEVRISGVLADPVIVRAVGGAVMQVYEHDPVTRGNNRDLQVPLLIDREEVGALRMALPPGRGLSATDRTLLHDVAERTALSIRRALLHEREHWIAVELQRGLLPKRLPEVAGIEIAVRYDVAGLGAEAGGDWYDAFPLAEGRIGLVVGDVAGRGIRAASAMGQLRSVTRAFALADDGRQTPGEVLTRLNRHQLALGQQELFTIVYAVIDPSAGIVSWTSAGHPPPLIGLAGGAWRYLEGAESLMGMQDVAYEHSRAFIGKGASLILYTDGLIERRGEPLDAGLRRLVRAAVSGPAEPQALCDHILREILPREQLHDDVTVLVVRTC